MMRFGWLLVVVACSKAEPPPSTNTREPGPAVAPRPPEIKVALAGVSLADNCAEGVRTKPLAPPPSAAAAGSAASPAASSEPASMQKEAVSARVSGDCAGDDCGKGPPPDCEQTAMQLSVQVPAGAVATKIKIKTVELLDEAGKPFGTLTPRAPSKWDGAGTYVPWDEAIAGGKTDLAVSYKLSSPDWSKIVGGKWGAAGKKFTLRVTVTISDQDRTIEKQTIVEVSPEAAVMT